MKYDGKLNLATGISARTKFWNNEKWLWSDFVTRLRKPNKTNETYQEFIRLSKKEQGKIKDVGGYVGGYLDNGKRSPSHVKSRRLLTLDIDFAHKEFWDDFTMGYAEAALIHSTHKHSDASPRFRLLMPLSRDCTPDEYVAVGRYVAGMIGIELFDNTTFETNRLMFWQSTPSDMQYYFEVQDGPWLDVDEVLNEYEDWTDTSAWPTADRKLNEIKANVKKQQDPQDKKGIIGAFCRTYSITEAIANFLEGVYIPTQLEDRYTYVSGSTAAGLIVYDDKFSYSHHGTDPTGGKLCNSFDLVRLHKFGHLDEEAELDKRKKPKSFAAMEDLITDDKAVGKLIALERVSDADYDFVEDLAEVEDDDLEWMSDLNKDRSGKFLSTSKNINLIFKKDIRLNKAFKYNEFDGKSYVTRTMPWRKVIDHETVRNLDFSGIRNYFDTIYGITGNTKIEDAMVIDFEKYKFHPVRSYLKNLQWDGIERVDTLLIDYFGVRDTAYTRESIRKTLTAGVARIFRPGVKFDLVLTLVGGQGVGKSTFARKLGGDWFSDSFDSVTGRGAFEQLQGKWILEMAELAALRKAEVESIKHFISKQDDTFRAAYARTTETLKRQCIFIGTTNNKEFLRDPTGNRRFMPVDLDEGSATKDVFKMSKVDVEQIWAEAVQIYEAGEPLFLSREAEMLAYTEQKNHSELDDRSGLIEDFLDTQLPGNWKDKDVFQRRDFFEGIKTETGEKGSQKRDFVCVAEVWCECLGNNKKDMTRYNTREINEILKHLDNWEYRSTTKNFPIYGKQRYYKRKLS